VSTDACKEVYDVLVAVCHAPDSVSDRLQFRHFWDGGENEYRFCGSLGFGGKFWRANYTPWHVSCYREDETLERLWLITRANKELAHLQDGGGE
jgi:hypothetical protein